MKKNILAFFLCCFLINFSQTTILQENFTNYLGTSGTLPAGWNFSYNGNYTTASSSGTSGPNSYKFGATAATISTPPFVSADTLHFWIKGNGTDTVSKLTISESPDSITWTVLAALDHLPTTGVKFGFPLNGTTTHLRFTYTKSLGNLAFDDFEIIKNSVISSPGTFKIYFTRPVNNSLATNQNAIYLNQSVDDTLIAYINRTKYTLDIAVYDYVQSFNISNIATAINNAYARGVKIRWIYDGSSSNSGLTSLNAAIPVLGSPVTSAYGIMHNKFMIADANSPLVTDAVVWTGSCNWTDQQINFDFNNVIIVQNQDLAQTFRSEFNEMWGDTGMTPNLTNSKFGPFKSDNTPHYFNIGGKFVDCFFSPSDGTNSRILSEINKANAQLFFGVYTFTSGVDADSIKSKIQNQGVYCAGIMDAGSTSFAAYDTLNPVMGSMLQIYSQTTSIYHNKFLIVDPCDALSDPTVETGSHNWTVGADTKNDENILIIRDAAIANIYLQSFSQNFADLGGTVSNCLVGVEQNNFNAGTVSIYPNPVSEVITIENSDEEINSVQVYDLSGRKITSYNNIKDKKVKINLRELNEGIYLLKINSSASNTIRKIIVQR